MNETERQLPTLWREPLRQRLRPAIVAVTGFLVAAVLATFYWRAEASDRANVHRGKYLATQGLCTDCHTPGYFFGKPDAARYLGGSEVGFEIPGLRSLPPVSNTVPGPFGASETPTSFVFKVVPPPHAAAK